MGRRRLNSRQCTLWVDDKSKDSVTLNRDVFSKDDVQTGDLAEIVAAEVNQVQQDSQDLGQHKAKDDRAKDAGAGGRGCKKSELRTMARRTRGSHWRSAIASQGRYLFVVGDMTTEQRSKQPNLQVSVGANIANAFGFKNHMQVEVAIVRGDSQRIDRNENTASHVELAFRDEYLTRSDMWRLVLSELSHMTVYKGQKVMFLGTIKARITQVYVLGKRVSSAFFAAATIPIFRSESARHMLFVQMSKEMWEFDADGSGEIMFNKVINGFLPELFNRWKDRGARHLVSIVLFTRVEQNGRDHVPETESNDNPHDIRFNYKDYYRVVVSEAASLQWTVILDELKREFRVFGRDISLNFTSRASESSSQPAHLNGDAQSISSHSGALLLAKPTPAIKGNVLEAVNLAVSQCSMDYVDRDLVRTGLSVVIITPGPGLFEVDYEMLRSTTETLTSNGIDIDLVCLARMPLHSIPLFKYRSPQLSSSSQRAPDMADHNTSNPNYSTSKDSVTEPNFLSHVQVSRNGVKSHIKNGPQNETWNYAVPTWMDISYWTGLTQQVLQRNDGHATLARRETSLRFTPRVKMYELQMMGIMENEMSNISLPHLPGGVSSIPNQIGAVPRKEPTLQPEELRQTGIRSGLIETSPAFSKFGRDRAISKDAREKYQWMDQYDDQAFLPPCEMQIAARSVTGRGNHASKYQQFRDSPFVNASAESRPRSPDQLNTPPRKAYLDRKMKERVAEVGGNMTMEKTKAGVGRSMGGTPRMPFQLGTPLSGRQSVRLKALASTELMTESATSGVVPSHLFPKGPESPVPRHSVIGPQLENPAGSKIQELNNDIASLPIPINLYASTPGKKCRLPDQSSRDEDLAQNEDNYRRVDVLQAASIVKQAGPKLDPASIAPQVSPTLPPDSALAPWLIMVNPSHPRKDGIELARRLGRWQHVFPYSFRSTRMRWKSLCAPAAVPLTTDRFPTAEQLASEYQESPYTVARDDDDMSEPPKARDDLLAEMVALRVAQGFQFVVGKAVAKALRHAPLKEIDIFREHLLTEDTATVVMSLGNCIHQIQRVGGSEIEVKRFIRKPTVDATMTNHSSTYGMFIRTRLAQKYEPYQVKLRTGREDYNWNYVDAFLAGYTDAFTEQLRFWRARFVLTPVEQPAAAKFPSNQINEDNEEEIRIEGIRKFTQMLQRYRFGVADDRRQGKEQSQDPNPLDIIYQTRDASDVVAAEYDSLLLLESDLYPRRSKLFMGEELFRRNDVNLSRLAQEIQGEKGVAMQDRRWHLRLHYNCFIGSEMTTWLLDNFGDLQTRDDAVDLGNDLMRKGLFVHVEKRHQFRDGNFFYQVGNEYRNPRIDTRRGWFGTRKTDRSIPSTPASEATRDSPLTDRSKGGIKSDIAVMDRGATTPLTAPGVKKLRVALSKVMRYDVDHRKRSYRPELINLHYDRLYHPDNCYHLRIDWMNVTAKLIDDAIVTWATVVEKFGLRLVEVPIQEASCIAELQPLQSPYLVQLARTPPADHPRMLFDTESLGSRTKMDPHFYHKAIMKRFGFVLDMEAAKSFPADVEVIYSWGKPSYRYSQYIHHSGLLLAQITDEGNFLLLPNRRYNDRSAGSGDRFDKGDPRDRRSGNYHSPFASPLVRAAYEPASSSMASAEPGSSSRVTAEELKDKFEQFCANTEKLQQAYDEITSTIISPGAVTTALESSIPSLGLPPSVTASQAPLLPSSNPSGAEESQTVEPIISG